MTSFLINPYRFAAAATDPNFANVSLLLHGDASPLVDSSGTPKTITAFGNAAYSTVHKKFGSGSIAFDGTGDYISAVSTVLPTTEDFTIEFWARMATTNTAYSAIRFLDTGGIRIGGGFVQLYRSTLNIVASYTATTGFDHYALVRGSGAVSIFFNGTKLTNDVANANPTASLDPLVCEIGRETNFYVALNGYIDDLRITKGVARYTANFTPPTAPFPDS